MTAIIKVLYAWIEADTDHAVHWKDSEACEVGRGEHRPRNWFSGLGSADDLTCEGCIAKLKEASQQG